jgi:hypothetical protein
MPSFSTIEVMILHPSAKTDRRLEAAFQGLLPLSGSSPMELGPTVSKPQGHIFGP